MTINGGTFCTCRMVRQPLSIFYFFSYMTSRARKNGWIHFCRTSMATPPHIPVPRARTFPNISPSTKNSRSFISWWNHNEMNHVSCDLPARPAYVADAGYPGPVHPPLKYWKLIRKRTSEKRKIHNIVTRTNGGSKKETETKAIDEHKRRKVLRMPYKSKQIYIVICPLPALSCPPSLSPQYPENIIYVHVSLYVIYT